MPLNHRQYVQWNGDRFRKWAEDIGTNTQTVISATLGGYKVEQQGYKVCMGMLKLADKYTPERLENACRKALTFTPHPSLKNIQAILSSGMDKVEESSPTFETDKVCKGIAKAAFDEICRCWRLSRSRGKNSTAEALKARLRRFVRTVSADGRKRRQRKARTAKALTMYDRKHPILKPEKARKVLGIDKRLFVWYNRRRDPAARFFSCPHEIRPSWLIRYRILFRTPARYDCMNTAAKLNTSAVLN